MKTRLLLTVCTVVFVGVIGYAYLTLPYKGGASSTTPTQTTTDASSQTSTQPASTDTGSTQNTNTSSGNTASTGATQSSGITMVMVAKHSSQSSCWTAINGKVYDVTSWIDQHPGGAQAILSLCGIDGSSAFNAQHGGQARPANELASFYIGPLAN